MTCMGTSYKCTCSEVQYEVLPEQLEGIALLAFVLVVQSAVSSMIVTPRYDHVITTATPELITKSTPDLRILRYEKLVYTLSPSPFGSLSSLESSIRCGAHRRPDITRFEGLTALTAYSVHLRCGELMRLLPHSSTSSMYVKPWKLLFGTTQITPHSADTQLPGTT